MISFLPFNHVVHSLTLFSFCKSQYTKTITLFALFAGASAFAPSQAGVRTSMALSFDYGEYDDQLWSNEAKKDVYAKWDPNAPRSTRNFNPFETWEGNSPDASGIYPGESWYKDPQRPDVSYAIMQVEKAEMEARVAAPKPGDVIGAPGCRNTKSQF